MCHNLLGLEAGYQVGLVPDLLLKYSYRISELIGSGLVRGDSFSQALVGPLSLSEGSGGRLQVSGGILQVSPQQHVDTEALLQLGLNWHICH